MNAPNSGNGSGKFDVGAHDMGGWVRVMAGQMASSVDDLGYYLSHRLSQWLRVNSHFRLISVVPIQRDGNTVELHAWYEQHVFPDKSGLVQKPQQ